MEQCDLYPDLPSPSDVIVVKRALQALPPSERYLPFYEAQEFLRADASPLDEAILDAFELPRDDCHGALAEIERKFGVNRRTVYRHRDDLRCKLARTTLAFLIAHLEMHGSETHIRNIEKILKECNDK